MRRFSGLSLFILFIFSWMGWSALYQLKMVAHRVEISAALPELANHEGLVQLIIAPDQQKLISWEEPGREFMYAGMMYDVLSLDTTTAGELQCSCYADRDETLLKQRYIAGLTPDAEPDSSPLSLLILKLWSVPTLVTSADFTLSGIKSVREVFNYSPWALNFILDPVSPPPEVSTELFL